MNWNNEFYTTKNGNVLAVTYKGNGYFTKFDGTYLRPVSKPQIAWFKTILTKIGVESNAAINAVISSPKWEYLWSVYNLDLSNYEESRSNNGGAYSTTTHSHFYMAKVRGKVTVREYETVYSSAEFSQSDDGEFEEDLYPLTLVNTDDERIRMVSKVKAHINGVEDFSRYLEEFSHVVSIKYALEAYSTVVDLVEDEFVSKQVEPIDRGKRVRMFHKMVKEL